LVRDLLDDAVEKINERKTKVPKFLVKDGVYNNLQVKIRIEPDFPAPYLVTVKMHGKTPSDPHCRVDKGFWRYSRALDYFNSLAAKLEKEEK
jgi:hypothetical protein